MKTSRKILIGVGAGIIVLGAVTAIVGPKVYRDFIAEPAEDAPSLSAAEGVIESADEPLDAEELAGDWTIGEGSEAGYRVDEVLNGTDVTVTGRTDQVTGTLSIDDSGLTLDSAEITVDTASIATDSDQRDAYFRDQALRTDEFPTATFTLLEPLALESAPDSGETVNAQATGELTIAGVTQKVTATIEARTDGETTEVAGSIPIEFSDFGVDAPNLGFVQVEDSGQVEFQLVADRG